MHKRFVINIVARILLIVCFFMLAPLGWALHDDPHSQEVKAFIFTIALGVIASGIILAFFRLKKSDYAKLNAKDGLAIVGLSWIVLSAFGALPLFLTHVVSSYTDAFFEIVSGFTTTGATVVTDIPQLPRGILFWRSLTHWLGGMGIIVLYLALLPVFSQNAFQLFKGESPGITVERVEPRMKETAKRLWGVYFFVSFAEVVLLIVCGMSLFDALCHTFGTMATGGFSTQNASIGAYGPAVQWVIIFFMFVAGANFMLHYNALRGKPTEYLKNEEFRTYLIIVLLGITGFALVLHVGAWPGSPIRDAAFQVVSIITTTGYTTADFDMWPALLRFILIIFMFMGGCGGSTGGGMKVVRLLISVKMALRSVVQAVYSNAIIPIRFNGGICSNRILEGVASYFILFILLFFLGTIVLTATEGCDLVTAFAASIASLSNIGPGLGQVGAAKNYAWISPPGKWMLIFLMLAGRLELYSILILFSFETWKK
jgi:trk system potassium uptake protein TrkH